MPWFKIPVYWQEYGVFECEAENLQAAIWKARIGEFPESDYVEDSFEVDYEGVAIYNKGVTKAEAMGADVEEADGRKADSPPAA